MPDVCPLCKKPFVDEVKEAVQMLGLSGWKKEEITPDVVKKAFRKLSKIEHPDVGGNIETFNKTVKARDTVLESMQDDTEKLRAKKKSEVTVEQFKSSLQRIKKWQPGQWCPWCGRG